MVRVAVVESGFVTTTFTAPAACAGVTAVIVVPPVTVTPVAATPPKVTVAPGWMFTPLIFTVVPPVVGPDVGEILLMERVERKTK